MKLEEISGYISIAKKAGYAIIGGENIKKHTQKLYLILIDEHAGESLKKQMKFIADKRNIPLINCSELSEDVKIENCKAIAFKNKGISESIIKKIKGE